MVVFTSIAGGVGSPERDSSPTAYEESLNCLSSLITRRTRADGTNKGDNFDLMFDYLKVPLLVLLFVAIFFDLFFLYDWHFAIICLVWIGRCWSWMARSLDWMLSMSPGLKERWMQSFAWPLIFLTFIVESDGCGFSMDEMLTKSRRVRHARSLSLFCGVADFGLGFSHPLT